MIEPNEYLGVHEGDGDSGHGVYIFLEALHLSDVIHYNTDYEVKQLAPREN